MVEPDLTFSLMLVPSDSTYYLLLFDRVMVAEKLDYWHRPTFLVSRITQNIPAVLLVRNKSQWWDLVFRLNHWDYIWELCWQPIDWPDLCCQ